MKKETEDDDGGELTQIIDYDGSFVGDVSRWLQRARLEDVGFRYSVVAVLGSQSSGKSTLLNTLFGTRFQVMDSQKGHSQTTKGLWIGRDVLGDGSTILFDVEGNDSRERGEDRLTFEHRAALFSLALADCVIVNMWYMSLGNYTASSYGLLKTVMEVNLELFLQEKECPKTLLLFVVRDWTEAMTPLPQMENKIYREYILHIWTSIKKPDGLTTSKPEDFFDFAVVGLPHALLMPIQFNSAVTLLRQRWAQELRPHRYSRHIPSDGFGVYCGGIWETIKQQAQLDIPSQKEMLATFRCQEIKNNVLLELRPALKDKLLMASQQELEYFDFWSRNIVRSAMEMYNESARRYQEAIYINIRVELLENVYVELQKVVDAHLSHSQRRLAHRFTAELEAIFKEPRLARGGGDPTEGISPLWKDFSSACEALQRSYINDFRSTAKGCEVSVRLKDENETICRVFDSRPDGLITSMEKDTSRVREKQLVCLEVVLKALCGESFDSIQDLLMAKNYTRQDFKAQLMKTMLRGKRKVERLLLESWRGLEDSEQSNELFEEFCGRAVLKELRSRLDAIANNLHQLIISRFETFFQYDEDEQPRQWPSLSGDALKLIFLNAKEQALAITESFGEFDIDASELLPCERLSEDDADLLGHPVLTEAKLNAAVHRALRTMQNACRDAQFIQATGGTTTWRNVPLWLWIVLLAFGWNELWGVIGLVFMSPLMLVTVLPFVVVVVVALVNGQVGLLIRMGSGSWMAAKAFLLPIALKTMSSILEKLHSLSGSGTFPPPSIRTGHNREEEKSNAETTTCVQTAGNRQFTPPHDERTGPPPGQKQHIFDTKVSSVQSDDEHGNDAVLPRPHRIAFKE